VQHDPLAGFAEADIQLDTVRPVRERAFKRRERILRRMIARTAMCKIQGRVFAQPLQ